MTEPEQADLTYYASSELADLLEQIALSSLTDPVRPPEYASFARYELVPLRQNEPGPAL